MEPSKVLLRIIIMVLFLVAILFTIRFCSNMLHKGKSMIGDGNLVRKEIAIKDHFSAITITGSLNAVIRQGDKPSVTLLADSNLQQYILFDFKEDMLTIRHKHNLHLSGPARVLITVPDLHAIVVEGAAEIHLPDTLFTSHFKLDIRGAAMADLALQCESLYCSISGAGEIKLKGRAVKAETQINGAGKLSGKGMVIQRHDIKVNGAGSAYTFVTDTLAATINGAGLVEYQGNPVVLPKINGVGTIRISEKP